MNIMRKLLIVSLLVAIAGFVHAQTRTVSGVITSNVDGKPIPEVNVRLVGAIEVTYSDEQGKYSINVDPRSTETLIFSHPEYDLIQVAVIGKSQLDINLSTKIRYNQYGAEVNRKPIQSEARDGILVFESQDQDFKFWLDLRLQMDGSYFWGETFKDENNPIGNGIELRRVRLALKSQLTKNFEAEIDLDFVDGYADPKDVFLKYNFGKSSYLKAGNFKEVFSMETNTTSRYLPFMERPIGTRVLSPSRHLGFQGGTQISSFLAVAGVHFQDVGDWEVIGLRQTRNRDFGVNEGYSLTGKLVFMPFLSDVDKGLHFGVAGSYRTPKLSTEAIDPTTKDLIVRFDTRSYPNINRKKYLDVRMAVENYTFSNFEFAGYYKGYRLQTEFSQAKINRTQDRGTENFSGFYIMNSYLLFGGKQQYNKNEGEFTKPKPGKDWGDLELALRYEYLDLNSREGSMWGMGEAWTAGINLHMTTNIKFVVNYRFVNHDRYANGANNADTGTVGRPQFVGTDVDGNLTSNPALVTEIGGKAGKDFSSISFRIDVAF